MSLPPSLRERRAFVDSSAYLALLDRADARHADAIAIVGYLADHRYRQYTTNVLLIESHALILSVLGNRAASRFVRDLERSSTTIIRVRARDEECAKEIIGRYADKDFSLADAISCSVMERLGITQAFSFDRDFAQYGFTTLQVPPGC